MNALLLKKMLHAQVMKGLRRNEDATRYHSWYQSIFIFTKKRKKQTRSQCGRVAIFSCSGFISNQMLF
jgi:hypothetical protein